MSGFCHFGLVYSWFCDRALTLPSCPVFMWVRGFECAWAVCSLVYAPCFVLERGVWVPALMSWVSVSCRGLDTHAPCSVLLWERAVSSSLACALSYPRVLCCFTQFMFFIGCLHSCYVLCCVAHSLCFALAVFIVVIVFLFVCLIIVFIIINVYFTSFYVKHFELPLCMKCAI